MKRFISFLTIFIFPLQLAVAKTPDAKPTDSKLLPVKTVFQQTASALCQKMESCTKQTVPTCTSEMERNLQEAYSAVPKNKKLEVSETELAQCTNNIKSMKCQELQNANQIPNCQYIELVTSQK